MKTVTVFIVSCEPAYEEALMALEARLAKALAPNEVVVSRIPVVAVHAVQRPVEAEGPKE